jgi:hypothetical protein
VRKLRYFERMVISTLVLCPPSEIINILYTGDILDTLSWWHRDLAQMGVKFNNSEASEQITS